MLKLRTNSDFLKTYSQGKKYFGYFQLVYFKPNNLNKNRLGVVASKKTGNAICRNKLKRLFRENYKIYEDNLKQGYDIVFIAKKNAGDQIKNLNLSMIKKDSLKIFKKAGMFK